MVYLKDEQIAKLRAENARLREALARLEGFAKPTCEKGLCTEPATRTAVYSHEGKEVARMNSCDAHGGRTVGPPSVGARLTNCLYLDGVRIFDPHKKESDR